MDSSAPRSLSPLVCALVLAGGQGVRAGAAVPKQFVPVGGRPVIAHTLSVFQSSAPVSHIHVVCAPQWADFVRRTAAEAGVEKLRTLPEAGDTGIHSLLNGLEELSRFYSDEDPENIWVMTHDSVRPLVTTTIITNNLSVMRQHGNASPPCKAPKPTWSAPTACRARSWCPAKPCGVPRPP